MSTPVTTSSSQTYVTVVMNDAANGTRKKYSFPEGTELNTTNHSYKISKKGIVKTELFYEEGNPWYSKRNAETIKGNTIDITLPQMIALGVFDTNKDYKIDNYDAKHVPLYMEGIPGDGFNGEGTLLAQEINERLVRSNSVFTVGDSSQCSTGVNVSRDGRFSISFVKKGEENYKEDNCKELDICLPQYLENLERQKAEEEAKQKAEEEAKQKAEELDNKYAEKHYIRKFFGITREEYEKNHERDY